MFNLDPQGTFTIKEVFILTHQHYRGRMDNRQQDIPRIHKIEMYKVYEHGKVPMDPSSVTHETEPGVKYEFIAYLRSTPVKKQINGNTRLLGRQIVDSYKITFETDQLNINTRRWKIRLGTNKIWRKPPKNQVLSIDHKTRANLGKDGVDALHDSKHSRGKMLENKDDWNSMIQGINADFYFRCMYTFYVYGHLYGSLPQVLMPLKPHDMNEKLIMFFPKHIINFFELLLRNGILQDTDRKV